MTTEIHEAHARWMSMEWQLMASARWLTVQEIMLLDHGAPGPQFKGFRGLYGAARKTADWICRVDTAPLPRIAIESGWSENLQRDKDVWLVGGAPDVQLVILLKWTKLSRSRVKGLIQVWKRDAAGNPVLRQEEQVFPGAGNQVISVTRREIFGNGLLPNRNGNDVWDFDISTLRTIAHEKLAAMGLTAAT